MFGYGPTRSEDHAGTSTKRRWIPAFAGMTEVRRNDRGRWERQSILISNWMVHQIIVAESGAVIVEVPQVETVTTAE